MEKKKSTLISRILTYLMILTLFVPGVAWLLGVETPNYSKEPLDPFPTLPLTRESGSQFDNWWSDHFPFRSQLVTAYNKVLDQGFAVSGNELVTVGKKGWYYYEPTVRSFLNAPDLSDNDIDRISESLGLQEAYVESQGAMFEIFLVPNKNTIYPENMPAFMRPVGTPSALDRLLEHLPETADLRDTLLPLKDSAFPVYHQEDSHWTNYGSYAAYKLLMDRFGQSDRIIDYGTPEITDGWEGDLTNMLYPAIPANDEQVLYPAWEQQFAYTRPLRTREDVEIQSRSLSGQPGNLLIFRDSFANAWMDFLSNSFGTVQLSRALPYRYDLMEQIDADFVALELVERNLDYLLQISPILEAQPAEDSSGLLNSELRELTVQTTVTEDNQMLFLNGLYEDQENGADITAVRIGVGDQIYSAFPIYRDEDVADRKWSYGFSAYFQAESLASEANVTLYYFVDGSWYQTHVSISNS